MSDALQYDPILKDVPVIQGFKVLEPCVLLQKLGEGGMGAVYRARHLNLNIDVAVKCLKIVTLGHDAEALARFEREANVAAQINDPNLIGVKDIRHAHGLSYIIMDFVDGETAEARVRRRGALPAAEACAIVLAASRGLAAAHVQQVIHRDIKPANILISRQGGVKLTDLGIAKANDSQESSLVTHSMMLMGTPQYMAPEQFEGAVNVTPASDVYSMAATLAFLVLGRHPIEGSSLPEIMRRVCNQGFPDLAALRADLPEELTRLLRRATGLQAAQRPADAREFAEDLRKCLEPLGGAPSLADTEAGRTIQEQNTVVPPTRNVMMQIRETLARRGPSNAALRAADAPADYPQTVMQGAAGAYPPTAMQGGAIPQTVSQGAQVPPHKQEHWAAPAPPRRFSGVTLALVAMLALGGAGVAWWLLNPPIPVPPTPIPTPAPPVADVAVGELTLDPVGPADKTLTAHLSYAVSGPDTVPDFQIRFFWAGNANQGFEEKDRIAVPFKTETAKGVYKTPVTLPLDERAAKAEFIGVELVTTDWTAKEKDVGNNRKTAKVERKAPPPLPPAPDISVTAWTLDPVRPEDAAVTGRLTYAVAGPAAVPDFQARFFWGGPSSSEFAEPNRINVPLRLETAQGPHETLVQLPLDERAAKAEFVGVELVTPGWTVAENNTGNNRRTAKLERKAAPPAPKPGPSKEEQAKMVFSTAQQEIAVRMKLGNWDRCLEVLNELLRQEGQSVPNVVRLADEALRELYDRNPEDLNTAKSERIVLVPNWKQKLEPLAEKGSKYAMMILTEGQIWYDERDTIQSTDLAKALYWAEKAANAGLTRACLYAGDIYGSTQQYSDPEKAVRYFALGDSLRDGDASARLARRYWNYRMKKSPNNPAPPTEKSEERQDRWGVALARKAAEAGSPRGMSVYSLYLEEGIGGPKNEKLAKDYLIKAAQRGYKPARAVCEQRDIKY